MARTPGIDVSRWQGEIDWRVVAAGGYRFVIIRATVGDYYTDPRFYENWRGAHDAGLLVSAYHVVKPKQTAEAQIDRLFDVLEGRRPDLPLVLDVELADDKPAPVVTGCVKQCAQLVAAREGRKPLIYTGSWFWNPNILHAPDWAEYDLWIAHYGVDEPTLPQDWTAWRFWQHSEKGSVAGVSSRNTDLNWFNGSHDDLLAYAAKEPDGEAAADDAAGAAEDAKPALRLRVTTPSLRVRSGPGVQYDYLEDLQSGDVIEILALDGSEVWVSFAPGKWAALTFRGERYMSFE